MDCTVICSFGIWVYTAGIISLHQCMQAHQQVTKMQCWDAKLEYALKHGLKLIHDKFWTFQTSDICWYEPENTFSEQMSSFLKLCVALPAQIPSYFCTLATLAQKLLTSIFVLLENIRQTYVTKDWFHLYSRYRISPYNFRPWIVFAAKIQFIR